LNGEESGEDGGVARNPCAKIENHEQIMEGGSGMSIKARPMKLGDIPKCATIACDSEIGRRYGFTQPGIETKLTGAMNGGSILIVAEVDSEIAGFDWVESRGAFGSSPYLKLIVVGSSARSRGVGAVLLDAFEKATVSVGTTYTLLVSDFNARAIGFYERHGYRKVGELPGFAIEGVSEILMVKAKPKKTV
jgi:ribosomal protein S18 acetylase RimI-like enzyme